MTTLSVSVPDSLGQQAREIAKQRGETVSDIMRRALTTYLSGILEEADDVRHVQEIKARIAAGQEGLHSHEDVWAQMDALEAEGALPD